MRAGRSARSMPQIFDRHTSLLDDGDIEKWLAERERLQDEADEAAAEAEAEHFDRLDE